MPKSEIEAVLRATIREERIKRLQKKGVKRPPFYWLCLKTIPTKLMVSNNKLKYPPVEDELPCGANLDEVVDYVSDWLSTNGF